MDKEFAPYEPSLALKELGFDEPCFGYYDTIAVTYLTYPSAINKNSDIENSLSISKQDKNVRCSAQLYQQAFRWFREKYKLDSSIALVANGYGFYVHKDRNYTNNGESYGFHITYEEAESACLDKLIEICKAKTNE